MTYIYMTYILYIYIYISKKLESLRLKHLFTTNLFRMTS